MEQRIFFRKSSYVLIFLTNVTILETKVFYLSKSVKNNDQNVSSGKRQGKVKGIVTPVFGSIKLSATEKNTRLKLPA